MVSSLPLLSCESSVSVKKILIEKKKQKKTRVKNFAAAATRFYCVLDHFVDIRLYKVNNYSFDCRSECS